MGTEENFLLSSEILTVGEMASFLKIPKSTVYKLVRDGQLPAIKVGKHWRFLRREIQNWIQVRDR